MQPHEAESSGYRRAGRTSEARKTVCRGEPSTCCCEERTREQRAREDRSPSTARCGASKSRPTWPAFCSRGRSTLLAEPLAAARTAADPQKALHLLRQTVSLSQQRELLKPCSKAANAERARAQDEPCRAPQRHLETLEVYGRECAPKLGCLASSEQPFAHQAESSRPEPAPRPASPLNRASCEGSQEPAGERMSGSGAQRKIGPRWPI